MTRHIENLNECTNPVSGDYLWIVDASAGSTDKDRKVNASKFAILTSGTWTPVLERSSSSITQTTSGWYVQLGSIIVCGGRVQVTAITTQGTSYWYIATLPAPATERAQCTFGYVTAMGTSAPVGIVDAASDKLYIGEYNASGDFANFGDIATGYIDFTMTYKV